MEDNKLPNETPREPENNTTQNSEQPTSSTENTGDTPVDSVQENTSTQETNISTESPSSTATVRNNDLNRINAAVEQVKSEVRKVIVGQDQMIYLMIVGILTGGHVLLEGVPGIAKTLTAKLLSQTLSVDFSRIQFTPDMMPTDVTGTNVYNMKTGEFNFKSGPVFSNIVLIDEINRAPAKTQASLFEVMQERQITVDGHTHHLEYPFFVIATQNPIEQEGTYKLPEAQLDRFLFRIKLHYPTLHEERAILGKFRNESSQESATAVQPVLSAEELKRCQEIVRSIHIKDELLDYIAGLVHQTREDASLYLGASPRASLSIMNASKAIAAMRGRDFVTPDDVKFIAPSVLNHRLILTADKEMEGVEVETVIQEILEKVEIPR